MAVVRRKPVTDGLKDMLELGTSRPVGIAKAPVKEDGSQEQMPYIVLIPRPRSRLRGPIFADSWSDADIEYTVKSVGLREDQTQLLADRVMEVMLKRNTDNEYTFYLDVGPNLKVMERRPDEYSLGDLIPVGKLFEVDDSFVIAVTTS